MPISPIPIAVLVLVVTLLELILALGLLVLLMARQRTRDPSRRERLGNIAARVTVPTIMAILVLGLVILLQDVV
jgi:putative copper export protein